MQMQVRVPFVFIFYYFLFSFLFSFPLPKILKISKSRRGFWFYPQGRQNSVVWNNRKINYRLISTTILSTICTFLRISIFFALKKILWSIMKKFTESLRIHNDKYRGVYMVHCFQQGCLVNRHRASSLTERLV